MTAILGGGISGLSAAYYALEYSKLGSIVLYEASNRFGGWIKSVTSPSGIIFEKGPRTIRPGGVAGENTLNLISKLDLNDKIVPIKMNHPAAKNRLIYVNKNLHKLPNSLSSLFTVQQPFNRRLVSIVWNDLFAPRVLNEDESIYSFVERRMGKDIADYLISPMISGICAGDAKEISVKFLLKNAFEFEQQYGSMTKGLFMNLLKKKKSNADTKNNKLNSTKSKFVEKSKLEGWAIWSLRGGLEQFPKALTKSLTSKSNISIRTKTKCEQITFKPGVVELSINDKIEKTCRVISSLSAKDLAPLVERQHPQLSRELNAIPFATVAVVNLHFSGDVLPLEGFGFLVPPSEELPILGVIFDSCVFDNKTDTVLTVMMGGAWFEKYFGNNVTNDQLLSTAVMHTKNILNIEVDPVESDVAVLKNCIPQYVVGHSQRVQRIQNYISAHKIPLVLCGSSYHGVGLNDVILHI